MKQKQEIKFSCLITNILFQGSLQLEIEKCEWFFLCAVRIQMRGKKK